jgi:hypothetical protein
VCEFEYLCSCANSDAPSVYYFNNNLLHKGGIYNLFPNNGEGELCPQSTKVKLVKDCKAVEIRSVIYFEISVLSEGGFRVL